MLLQKGLCLLGREVLEARSLESLCDGSAGLRSQSRKLPACTLRLPVEKLLGSQTELLLLLLLRLLAKLLLSQVETLLLLGKLSLLLQLLSRELHLVELLVCCAAELSSFPLLLVNRRDNLPKIGLPRKPRLIAPDLFSLRHNVLIRQLSERERCQGVGLWQFKRVVHLVIFVLLIIHVSSRTKESGPKFRVIHRKVEGSTWPRSRSRRWRWTRRSRWTTSRFRGLSI